MPDAAADLSIRPARPEDVAELCALLNQIIAIGGTTAYEQPLSDAEFEAYFLSGPDVLSCLVAEAPSSGRLLGFQSLERNSRLPEGWADIATFARAQPKRPGVGRALFAETRARAAALGLRAIRAKIRADNVGGLAYYARIGFEDYEVARAVPLSDGTPVDRISKRFLLG